MDSTAYNQGFDPVEEDYRGVGYFLYTTTRDSEGEESGDMLFCSPTFYSLKECNEFYESLSHDELVEIGWLNEGWASTFVVLAVKAWYSHNGLTSSEDYVWERSYPITWKDGTPTIHWEKEERE